MNKLAVVVVLLLAGGYFAWVYYEQSAPVLFCLTKTETCTTIQNKEISNDRAHLAGCMSVSGSEVYCKGDYRLYKLDELKAKLRVECRKMNGRLSQWDICVGKGAPAKQFNPFTGQWGNVRE